MDAGLAEGSFNEGLSLTTVTKFGFVVYDLVLGSGWLLAMGAGQALGSFNNGFSLTTVTKFGVVVYDIAIQKN